MSRHDPCCSRCKTPSGVCATKRTCNHHRDAAYKAAQADAAAAAAREAQLKAFKDDLQGPFHTRPRR